MKLRVTVTFDYDVEPEYYPEDARTPEKMAAFDFATDPAFLSEGFGYTVDAEEVPSV